MRFASATARIIRLSWPTRPLQKVVMGALRTKHTLKVIWWRDVRIAEREQRFQKLEGLNRGGPYEVAADELLRRKVAGVKLGQLPHVELYSVLPLHAADHAAVLDGVLPRVLRNYIVPDLQDERRAEGFAAATQ